MVIIYKQDTKDIVSFESNVMVPQLPFNIPLEEKKAHYNSLGQGFISIPYEMGSYIFFFKLGFDENNNFIGLQPK